MMNKKVSMGLLISICALVCAVTFTLTMFVSVGLFDSKMNSTKAREAMYTRIAEVDSYVRENYVGEIDDEQLMNFLLKGYVNGIGDTYARYYTAAEWQSIQSSFTGTVNGIGIKSKVDSTGYLRVVKVYDNSPAKEAGIAVGDLIISVGGEDVLSIGASKANALILGDPGTQVHINYLRENEEKQADLVRRAMSIASVEYQMVDKSAYIKISEFGTNTAVQFESVLGQAMANHATSLVIDLRDNSGGLTSSCAKILDMLVGESDMVKAQYKDEKVEVLYTSDKNKTDLPITLVVNENTASSAELFTAVLRDEVGAKIVGATTYGKGVMQEYKQLSDGSGIDVTIAYLMTSKDTKFHKTGVKPDYEIMLTTAQQQTAYQFTVANDPILNKAFEVASGLSTKKSSAAPPTTSQAPKPETQTDTAAFAENYLYA